MAVLIRFVAAMGLIAALIPVPAQAQPVRTEIVGISGEMLTNVRIGLSLKQAEDLEQVSVWRLRQMARHAREEVRDALEPFGYYSANVSVRLEEPVEPGGPRRARVEVMPGEPVRVVARNVALSPQALEIEAFERWLENWPLEIDAVLRHPPYTQALENLRQLAENHGFFDGRFVQRSIRVEPARNAARIGVDYDAGRRYRIGNIDFGDTGFDHDLMNALTIVDRGQPYLARDIDRQREVLVRAGYFEQVIIEQRRNAESGEVDLDYRLEKRPPNTWRVLAGFGTDTGPRGQLGWTRHYLSSRGDRLETRFGAQEKDSEFVLRSDYQHPFGSEPGNFLTVGVLLRRERDRFRFEDENRVEAVFDPFSGSRYQAELSVGRLRERPLLAGPYRPVVERLFISFLHERFDAFSEGSLDAEQEALLAANPGIAPFLDTSTNTVAVGGEWTLSRLSGEGFGTQGLFARTRIMGALEALGSDTSFLQGYMTARWHWLLAPRHKLLMRGEIGYTEADTEVFDLSIPNDPRELRLEITELPELFRFKTGGDRSVRGFGFEVLSTNRNGANHTLVGSLEYEYNFFGDFSVAAFVDHGNAFNDFSKPRLKTGFGAGVRWYTLIGPVQLDIARPVEDSGIRIHFTIGTSLF